MTSTRAKTLRCLEKMKVKIYRGHEEIGASCIEVRTEKTRVVFDIGSEIEGEPAVLPESVKEVNAVFITHAHPDHFGLIHQVPENVPVYCGALTGDIIRILTAFNTHYEKVERDFCHFADHKEIQIGDIRITPYANDHSVPDSYAFLVEADGKRLLISGDFRLHGRKAALMRIMMKDLAEPDALIVDGTCVGKEPYHSEGLSCANEAEVEEAMLNVFQSEELPAFVEMSSINVDRIVSAFKAAIRAKRLFVMDIYTAVILWVMNKKHGRNVPIHEWENVRVLSRGDLSHHHRNITFANKEALGLEEFWSTLFRINALHVNDLMGKDLSRYVFKFRIEPLLEALSIEKASYIYSLWSGYMRPEFDKKGRYEKLKNSSQVIFHDIHTGGHAFQEDLYRFIETIAPKKLIPFHTNNPDGFPFANAIIHQSEIVL